MCMRIKAKHTASLGDYDLDVEELIDISNESIESLQQFTRAQLGILCQQRRLPYSGNKLHLVERLLNHKLTSTDPGDVIGDFLKCCSYMSGQYGQCQVQFLSGWKVLTLALYD